MSRRGDNIRKRKDGRWEGRYKKGRTAKGCIVYGSVYGKTFREVKDKMTSISQNALTPSVLTAKENTFGEILNLWMSNNKIRLKGGTVSKYQNLIDTHIMPDLGMIRVADLTATKINSFLEKKLLSGRIDGSGGLSSSYVRSIMLIVNSAIKYAVNEELCSPLKTPVCKPVSSKTDFTILSLEEQKNLETALLSNFNTTCAGIFISLHTGLRIGEICGLSWNDIDFKKQIIHVRHTIARVKKNESFTSSTELILDTPKTKSSVRDIPISSILLPVLLKLRTISPKGFVISGTNEFIKPRTFEYRYHKILDSIGITSINYHALRHTFATRCVEAGVDIKSLSEILGHGNVSVTLNTYVHSSLEMKRCQLEKLATLSA